MTDAIYRRARAEAASAERRERSFARRAAADRVAQNEDFGEWLYAVLDDLNAFAEDEGLLTEFGQGIRAAASRIRNRLAETDAGAALMCRFATRAIMERHDDFKKGLNKEKERNER